MNAVWGLSLLLLLQSPAAAAADQEVALEEGSEADFFEEEGAPAQEVALEEGSEADFFADDAAAPASAAAADAEEEEVVFADDGELVGEQSGAPAFGAAFPEHDPRRWLLLLPLALLGLFTLNVRWRAPSK